MAGHTPFFQLWSAEKRLWKALCRILFTKPSGTIVPVLQLWDYSARSWVTATGAAPLVASVVRNGAGDFTVKLQDVYQRIYSVIPTWMNPASVGLPLAPNVSVETDGTNPVADGGATIEVITSTLVATVSRGTADTVASTGVITNGSPDTIVITSTVTRGTADTVAMTNTATDPATNEVLALEITLGDSSSP